MTTRTTSRECPGVACLSAWPLDLTATPHRYTTYILFFFVLSLFMMVCGVSVVRTCGRTDKKTKEVRFLVGRRWGVPRKQNRAAFPPPPPRPPPC